MRLIDAPDYWTAPLATVQSADVVLTSIGAGAVASVRDKRLRAREASIVFSDLDRLEQLIEAAEDWRRIHRRTCAKDADDCDECTRRSTLEILQRFGFLEDLVEESMPWANLTVSEVSRRLEALTRLTRQVIKARSRRYAAASSAYAAPITGPVRLLITSLTSAPCAPPEQFEPQLNEGLRAA